MRENPETSLRVLRLLRDEPAYPSQHDERSVARELGISEAKALLHIKCCMEAGLIDAEIGGAGTTDHPSDFFIRWIRGLTVMGQDFVRNADADDGGWWRKALKALKNQGIPATTKAIGQAMQTLTGQAISAGLGQH